MTKEDAKLSNEDEEWVKAVSQLAIQIGRKLSEIQFLREGEQDRISYRLAEVANIGSNIASRTVPRLLVAEGPELQDTSVDLLWDLREMKEAIESLESDIERLMNHLNP
jgi:hypothetical protein